MHAHQPSACVLASRARQQASRSLNPSGTKTSSGCSVVSRQGSTLAAHLPAVPGVLRPPLQPLPPPRCPPMPLRCPPTRCPPTRPTPGPRPQLCPRTPGSPSPTPPATPPTSGGAPPTTRQVHPDLFDSFGRGFAPVGFDSAQQLFVKRC